MKLLFSLLILFVFSYAQDCQSLTSRKATLEKEAIYEELLTEADRLIKEGCSSGSKKLLSSADKVLLALEVLKYEEVELPSDKRLINIVVRKKMRNALLMLNETGKYKNLNRNLYSYQLLFYQVARENKKVKDFNYALKYFQASYLLGRAIMELR